MYIPHDYWMICNRTGIKFRRSEMVQEFSGAGMAEGLWVNKSSLDPIHPQDFVTGVEDDPSVYPTSADTAQQTGDTALIYAMPQYSKIAVIPTSLAEEDESIGIVMNNGIVFWDFAQTFHENAEPVYDANGELVYAADGVLLARSDVYDTIFISTPIHQIADAANTVYVPSVNNEEWT